MIRFLPDSWFDAVMRPIAMVAPDAGVYVEIMAPDVRFAAMLVLALVLLVTVRKLPRKVTPLLALCVWLGVAFGVWLATSGNGRYFMAGLLIAGPICIGLIARIPATPSLRLTLAVGVVALQGWVIWQNNPWGWWGLAPWREAPFFQTDIDAQAREEPATYVTVANISYSLIASQFAPASRWVNISSLPDVSAGGSDNRRVQASLAASPRIKLLVPTRPEYMTADGQPGAQLRVIIDEMLANQRLALATPLRCRTLRSRGLATSALKDVAATAPEHVAKFGFWICDLRYPIAAPVKEKKSDPAANAAFALVEQQCPRFFQPGQTSAARFEGGWLRVYPQADLRLYLMDDGKIYYKYWRALNIEALTSVKDLQAGVRLTCTIRGRSGLPWEREI